MRYVGESCPIHDAVNKEPKEPGPLLTSGDDRSHVKEQIPVAWVGQ